MKIERVKKGATVDVYVVLDGYPSGNPTLALTLSDDTAFSATMTPVVAAQAVSGIEDDRQTLTLSSSLADSFATRERGPVAVKMDGQIIMATADTVVGTTLTLSQPLPSGGTPESVAWLTCRAEIGPTYLAGAGPTATGGVRLDGKVTYTATAPGAAQTDDFDRSYALDVEDRVFWPGLTVPVALQKLGALSAVTGGLSQLPRGPGLQPLIDSTLDELRGMVAEGVRARGYEIDDVVGAGDFLEAQVLLLRAELTGGANPAAESDRLRARAAAIVARKAKNLKLDTTEDDKVDTTANVGVGLPSAFSKGLPSAAGLWNMDYVS